jgi:hypothetical protein
MTGRPRLRKTPYYLRSLATLVGLATVAGRSCSATAR